MSKCRHENADHLWPSDVLLVRNRFAGIALVEQLRCIDCGAWLSLGESDEHVSDEVEIEIKAAEIAAAVREPVNVFIVEELTASERLGWCGWVDEQSVGIKLNLAGYIARQIYEHDKEER